MSEIRPISEWPLPKIREYLAEVGDIDALNELQPAGPAGMAIRMPTRAWRETGMIIGFMPENINASDPFVIQPLHEVSADVGLIGKRIKLTLDSFYVHSYPGVGRHRILCEFRGRNQTQDITEDLTFALQMSANDGARAAVANKPIFQGLTVGPDGISFAGRTVNVKSDFDDLLIAALDSSEFKSGLSLLHSAQPALRPFSSLATGFVKTIVQRKYNCSVMEFDLGLDFSEGAASARLAKGSYVVVQGPSRAWDWSCFRYSPGSQVVVRADNGETLNLNHFIVGIREFI